MIILDDASNESDRIRSIVESYPNTTYLFSKTQIGPAGGRNRGLREATTPFCLSIDDDCYLDATPDLSPWLGDRLEDRDIAIVGFRYYNVHEGVFAPTSNDAGPAKAYLGGANLMRRDAVLKAGGYLDWLIFGGEDTELGMRLRRLGYRVWYDPSVVVHHDHSQEGRDKGLGSLLYVRNTVAVNSLHHGGLLGLSIGLGKALRRGIFATDVPRRTPVGILMGLALAWRHRHAGQELFAASRRYVPTGSSLS
jgi:GT2 family glycosyltransferase